MKALLNKFIGVSHGHKVISRTQAEQLQFDHQWQDPELPKKQLSIVKKQLQKIATTQVYPPHMQVLVDQMRLVTQPNDKILEIGCSSGYNSEILKLAKVEIDYTGCDYSQSFVDLAKKLYPALHFDICNATALPYQDNQFDLTISGCCILHILNYPKAIQETARVVKRYAIFSRTPVLHIQPTTYTTKIGYDIPMVEIFFNETELVTLFRQAGLRVLAINTFAGGPKLAGISEQNFCKTYLCEKIERL